jgi:hypothetical protein
MREIGSSGGERLEIHNCSVDEQMAEAHLCGRVHLPTGRTCALPEAHTGGCVFELSKREDRAGHRASH